MNKKDLLGFIQAAYDAGFNAYRVLKVPQSAEDYAVVRGGTLQPILDQVEDSLGSVPGENGNLKAKGREAYDGWSEDGDGSPIKLGKDE